MGLIFPISSRPIMQGPISALITTRYRRQAYRLSNVGVYTNVAEGFEERNTRDERPKQKSCTRKCTSAKERKRERASCKRERATCTRKCDVAWCAPYIGHTSRARRGESEESGGWVNGSQGTTIYKNIVIKIKQRFFYIGFRGELPLDWVFPSGKMAVATIGPAGQ